MLWTSYEFIYFLMLLKLCQMHGLTFQVRKEGPKEWPAQLVLFGPIKARALFTTFGYG
jgi:hypothetical protein